MEENDDRELLREFVSRRCESAFAQLVRRHVDLVYSAARRQMKDLAGAEDVTQEVFVTLATKAKTIRDGEALAGWLLVTTRFVALNQLRSNERRRRHEHEAAVMQFQQTQSGSGDDVPLWQSIGPVLDEAIATLKSEDRDAVVMRYFQGRSVAEVAAALGVSQEAAQKRVSRAVERLRGIFASRAITASEAGLTSILSANAVAAAPAMLAAKVAAAAFAKATFASATSSITIGKGTATTLMAAKAKIIAATAAGILLAGITGTIAYQQVSGSGSKSREVTLSPASSSDSQAGTLNVSLPRGPAYTTAPGVSWMQEFHRVYDLADGEIVRFVPQPFIADRLAYYKAYLDPAQVKSAPNGPDVFVFEYSDPHTLKWRGAMYSGGTAGDINYALGGVADVDKPHVRIPRNILALPMAGDWVYRAGSTPEQRMEAISKLIADKLKQPNGKLVQKPMERDAIVVSGSYDYHPLPASQKQLNGTGTNGPNPVYLFGGDKAGESRGGGTSTLSGLLEYVGSACGRPIALETTVPGDVLVSWQNCLYYSTRPDTGEMGDADVDSVLANMEKQTSLQFNRAKRTLPTWVWEKGG